MIGNAAGPVMAIYLLSMKLPKYSFIGTGAWFFMIINLVKLPLQYFVWKGITLHTLTLNAMMIPVIILGTVIGIVVVKKIPELPFKIAIILLAAVSAVKLLM